ncbi:MAG TPA: hypothetical protein VK400_11335 [Pyrinomonadaceae bacterium]|nr:hypothetical protein [Pyrinomonadaceae bacterium]
MMYSRFSCGRIKNTLTLLCVGGVFLCVTLGCSLLKNQRGARHPGWKMQEACAYFNDVNLKFTGEPTDELCRGGGFTRADGLLYHQGSPENIGSISYRVEGKAGTADKIELSSNTDSPGGARHKAFMNYSEKLFRKAFGTPVPEDVKTSLREMKGTVNKPEVFTVKDAKISVYENSGYNKIIIQR